ncbi:unnamed protein product, partial [Brachionus calyciflorus]
MVINSDNVEVFMTNIEQFFRSNFDFDKLILSANEIVRMTKDEFVNRLTLFAGDDKSNEKKEKLDVLRIKLATHVITKLELKKNIMVQNRNKCSKMALDIWYLINSIVDEKPSNECIEILTKAKGYGLDQTFNEINVLENSNDGKKVLDAVFDIVRNLEESNKKILKAIESLTIENNQLRTKIDHLSKFKNFNILNSDNFGQVNQEGMSSTCTNSGVESLNEQNNTFSFVVKNGTPYYTQGNKSNSKIVVGSKQLSKLAAAFTIFDYFTSNWPNKTTQE